MKISLKTMYKESDKISLIKSFEPIFDSKSSVLILGTMASPASLKSGFYYGHPQNAFWRILSDITKDSVAITVEEKKTFLLRNGIALWDTLKSCERIGALDSDIRAPQPNDIAQLTQQCPTLKAVLLNGGVAFNFYKRYHAPHIKLPFYKLPSTSPANAKGGYEKKMSIWKTAFKNII
jgi:TDG/mug DNA glycosylase family protein